MQGKREKNEKNTKLFRVAEKLRRKNDPPLRILAGFAGPIWVKLRGEKSHGLMAFGGHPEWAFPDAFRQSDTKLGMFFTGLETGCFTGFYGTSFGKMGP